MTQRASVVLLALMVAAPAAAQLPPTPPVTERDYVIGAQDALVITSFDQSDLSGRFAVETDGTFAFPLLGRVEAAGLTLRQFEGVLRQRLVAGGFFKNPQITVAIAQYRSQKIYVLGEVRKPGIYAISSAMRLVEALALADSTLPTAGPDIVIIPSADGNHSSEEARTARISLTDLQNGNVGLNVPLKDGDTILVPRAEEVYVFGEVKNPGAYPLRQEDMTVLQALSLAGGVTDRGATGRIEIVRIVDGQREEISTELTDVVLPGDTVVVPQRYF